MHFDSVWSLHLSHHSDTRIIFRAFGHVKRHLTSWCHFDIDTLTVSLNGDPTTGATDSRNYAQVTYNYMYCPPLITDVTIYTPPPPDDPIHYKRSGTTISVLGKNFLSTQSSINYNGYDCPLDSTKSGTSTLVCHRIFAENSFVQYEFSGKVLTLSGLYGAGVHGSGFRARCSSRSRLCHSQNTCSKFDEWLWNNRWQSNGKFFELFCEYLLEVQTNCIRVLVRLRRMYRSKCGTVVTRKCRDSFALIQIRVISYVTKKFFMREPNRNFQ